MNKIIIIFVGLIIIIILMKFLIYQYTGWIKFNMKYEENFQVLNTNPKKISKIIFTDVKYTLIANDNSIAEIDVSNILNKMIKAYKNSDNENYRFKLADPGLNEYSFVINGISNKDSLVVVGKNINTGENIYDLPEKWRTKKVSLIGYYKLLN